MKKSSQALNQAQKAISDLKKAIHSFLSDQKDELSNAEIGRTLDIYHGYGGKHKGHISRTLLELMQLDGIVEQNKATKKWSLKNN